jgi:predicted DNA-binding transcriptional regulator AlpA
MSAETRLLTEVQVEATYGLARRTLQRWRLTGGGPTYHKLGRSVRYRRADVEAFIAAGARHSTSVAVCASAAGGV